jgi:hypothetical protein
MAGRLGNVLGVAADPATRKCDWCGDPGVKAIEIRKPRKVVGPVPLPLLEARTCGRTHRRGHPQPTEEGCSVTGRELYEKWLELRGLPALAGIPGSDTAAWNTLSLHDTLAWGDLAAHLQTSQPEEAKA